MSVAHHNARPNGPALGEILAAIGTLLQVSRYWKLNSCKPIAHGDCTISYSYCALPKRKGTMPQLPIMANRNQMPPPIKQVIDDRTGIERWLRVLALATPLMPLLVDVHSRQDSTSC